LSSVSPDVSDPYLFLPDRLDLLVRYLVQDGFIDAKLYQSGSHVRHDRTIIMTDDALKIMLTTAGRTFITNLEDLS
jgi:hypothetical protein